jgi:hypothetical protein
LRFDFFIGRKTFGKRFGLLAFPSLEVGRLEFRGFRVRLGPGQSSLDDGGPSRGRKSLESLDGPVMIGAAVGQRLLPHSLQVSYFNFGKRRGSRKGKPVSRRLLDQSTHSIPPTSRISIHINQRKTGIKVKRLDFLDIPGFPVL